jgi:hypothetical protein
VTFGSSWDGPGTGLNELFPDTYAAGAPDFAAGVYLITVIGGNSALYGQDVIGFEGDTFCARSADGCVLGKPDAFSTHPTVLQTTLDRPWRLWGWSPPLGKVNSNGSQFAIAAIGQGQWRWGFEDLPGGDYDYQDVYGTIQFLHGLTPEPTPTPQCVNCDPPVTPVPEPSTLMLIGCALVLSCLRKRAV